MKLKLNQLDLLLLHKQVFNFSGRYSIYKTFCFSIEMEHMIPDVPLVTLPVPIYLPSPTPSYRLFKPKAVPIPIPFFVPIMIPVPRKTFKNIRDYLQVRFFFLVFL